MICDESIGSPQKRGTRSGVLSLQVVDELEHRRLFLDRQGVDSANQASTCRLKQV